MRWLSLLFSFFLGKFNVAHTPSLKESIAFLFEEAATRSRKPAMLILGGLACVLFLCGGFFMGLIDLTTQIDRDGTARATAGAISGFVLVAMALGVFYWIFSHAWPDIRSQKTEQPGKEHASPSSFEHALTLLVMDYIKEREMRREEFRHHPPSQPSQPSSSSKPEPSPPLYN
jgi:hypothetical protein